MAIFTQIDLVAYKKRLERQKEVLHLSLVFDNEEKIQVQKCYDDLIEICNNVIAFNREVIV